MAVKDEIFHHDTQALILSSPVHLYRAHMHAIHWQLRDLLSIVSGSSIYYSSGEEIYRLDPISRQREVLATLTFYPRCLSAVDGWICCGGEQGDFAAIKIPSTLGQPDDFEQRLDADRRLDLGDIFRTPSDHEGNARIRSVAGSRERPVVLSSKVGKEIVNCVTLWCPRGDEGPEVYADPVAVLSNNDSSVSIVHLHTSDVIQQIWLDDCVNRALISPNGERLIAIGDDPYLHVYIRVAVTKDTVTNKYTREFHWVEHGRIQIQGQMLRPRKDDEMRGSFAAAFSPTGRFLAIGTQYGSISIFDTRFLTHSYRDPLVATCSSSRPHTKAGAIRVMQFSAEPIGLLAVTEDSGRVLVFDVRHGFKSRQIIDVNSQTEDVLPITIADRPADPSTDPRLRSFQSSSDAGLPVSDAQSRLRMLETHYRVEQLQSERRMQLRDGPPFTTAETEVLDEMSAQRALRDRQAERALLNMRAAPEADVLATLTDPTISEDRPSLVLPQSLRDFVSGRNSTESLRAYVAERNTDRERRGQVPRRRESVILGTTANALDREPPAREADVLALPGRSSGVPASRTETTSSSDAWAQLEALYTMTIDPPSADSTTRMRTEIEPDGTRAERNRRLTAHWNRSEPRHFVRLGLGTRNLTRVAPPEPNDTTGISWNQDGAILYVGTATGIYEYHVDVQARKFHPAIKMR